MEREKEKVREKKERGLVPTLFTVVTTAGRPRDGNGQATHLVRGKEDGTAVMFGVGHQDGGEKRRGLGLGFERALTTNSF
jgi:hypothetical protein